MLFSKYRTIAIVAVALLISGCVTTAKQLRETSDHTAKLTIDQNYQEVYGHLLTTARDCLAVSLNRWVSNKVVGDLYADLSFGEISYYQDNVRDMHLAYVKVAKAGQGSEVSIATGSQLAWASDKLLKQFEGWAKGGSGC